MYSSTIKDYHIYYHAFISLTVAAKQTWLMICIL